MKRFLGLVLAVLFVFGFTALAFAQDVKLTGEIKIWNWYRDNMSTGAGLSNNASTATPSQAFSMTRVRLGVDIKISDNVKGMIQLETGGLSEVTGAALTGAATAGDTADFYGWGALNAKQAGVNLREAWILYTGSGLLGVPAGLKIGHMPLILGHGKFFNATRYGSDAIVLFADPTKQLHLGVLTLKVAEYTMADINAANTSDVDVYAVVVTYKLDDKNNIGVNYVRANDPDSTLALRRFQNLMLHATGEIGGFGYKAEADFQFGEVNQAVPVVKFKGSGVFLEVSKKLEPVNIRMSYARGSGDNDNTDGKNKSFIVFLGPDMNIAWIYEYQIRSAAATSQGAFSAGTSTAGICNTTLYNLGLDTELAKDVKLALDAYILRATQTAANTSKKVGSEVDAKITYKVSKGLTWTILAGFFSPGKYYEDAGIVAAGAKKTATAARSDLTLSF